MSLQGKPSQSKTFCCETRLDVRTAAAILRAYIRSDDGEIPATKSALISAALEDFLTILVKNGLAEEFSSSEEAMEYIQEKIRPTVYNRAERSFIKQIAIEDSLPSAEKTPLADEIERRLRALDEGEV